MKLDRNLLNMIHSIVTGLSYIKSYTGCVITTTIDSDKPDINFTLYGYNDDGQDNYVGSIDKSNIGNRAIITYEFKEYPKILNDMDQYSFKISINENNCIIPIDTLFENSIYGRSSSINSGTIEVRYSINKTNRVTIFHIDKDNKASDYDENRCHLIDKINTTLDYMESEYVISHIEIVYDINIDDITVWISYSPKDNLNAILWSSILMHIDYTNNDEYDRQKNINIVKGKCNVKIYSSIRTGTEFNHIFDIDNGIGTPYNKMVIPNTINNTDIKFVAHLQYHKCYTEIDSDELVCAENTNPVDCPIDFDDLYIIKIL